MDSSTSKEIVLDDGHTYSLVKLPGPDTPLVLKEREHLLRSLDLKTLLIDLGRLGNCVRIAYHGVAGFTELQIEIQRIGYDVTRLSDKSAITIGKFKNTSTTILGSLKATYEFLLDGFEDMALETLADVADTAKAMVIAAEELHEDFNKQAKTVITALEKTQKTKGKEDDKIKEKQMQKEKMEEIKAKTEQVTKQAAENEQKLKQLIQEADAKEEKAIADIQHIRGEEKRRYEEEQRRREEERKRREEERKRHEEEQRRRHEEAIQRYEKEQQRREKEQRRREEEQRHREEEERQRQKDEAGVFTQLYGYFFAPSDSGATRPQQRHVDVPLYSSAVPHDLYVPKQLDIQQLDTHLQNTSIQDSAYEESVKSNLKVVEERARAAQNEKIENLKKMREKQEIRSKALADLAEFAIKIQNIEASENQMSAAADALQHAVGALKSLAAVMLRAALFWKQLQEHCSSLATHKVKNLIEMAMKYPEEKRIKFWTADGFKSKAVEYYARWVALENVSGIYMERIKLTQQRLYLYIQEALPPDEARKEVKKLAQTFLAELKTNLKEVDDKIKELEEQEHLKEVQLQDNDKAKKVADESQETV